MLYFIYSWDKHIIKDSCFLVVFKCLSIYFLLFCIAQPNLVYYYSYPCLITNIPKIQYNTEVLTLLLTGFSKHCWTKRVQGRARGTLFIRRMRGGWLLLQNRWRWNYSLKNTILEGKCCILFINNVNFLLFSIHWLTA